MQRGPSPGADCLPAAAAVAAAGQAVGEAAEQRDQAQAAPR